MEILLACLSVASVLSAQSPSERGALALAELRSELATLAFVHDAWVRDGDYETAVFVPAEGRIVALTHDGECQVLDDDGRVVRSFLLPQTGQRTVLETVSFAPGDGGLIVYSGWGKRLVATDLSGCVRWYTNYDEFAIDSVCVADLDGDSSDEVIVGHNGAGGIRVLSGADGSELWQGDGSNVWGIAVANVTGDDAPEVLVTAQRQSLTVFDRKGEPMTPLGVGLYATDLQVLDGGELLLWGSKAPRDDWLVLVDPSTGATEWSVATEGGAGAASPLAVTADSALVAVVGTSRDSGGRHGRLQVVDLRDGGVLVDREFEAALRPAWAPGNIAGEWRLVLAGWGGLLCVDLERAR